ncbi:GPI ethanolamine phosphate transferase 1-like isoform X2 [Triticum dicoccoides]|uniref:GPI ethanolamine phosphate transferase 1-like isoform X2 n=1 Tax=Triticum dicoccoides TaxID=85692 RepID=UPI000E7868B7|nr:GPI ethanolamine phosphate transferase 1-like isoform X2 [Triticum dicoccoides]
MAGRPRPQAHSPSASTRRRERWLVVLGIVLHAVYMLSIFDIYFKSPIVHGMAPVPPRLSAPPAKRLVLLVADGLRADKFFEPDERGRYRAPFLRGVIEEKGRWGVSHARPPTESRPGHVAIIAGFYEDPSAVTKGWKANPVEFDSVFNQSRHTISFGSPDIVPIFCSSLPHCTWGSYPHEYEDFATDASFLDHWSFDQFEGLLNRSLDDVKLRQLLLQDKLVIFLHFLGCDSNGHAHRPYSSIYLNNVKVVDEIAERMYNLMESYFNDNRTAYVFTADHGMSDKGSHGDGHPSNTDTPLVAWGAGIRSPKFLAYTDKPDDGFRFVDDHRHDMPTPQNWALEGFERVDVNQADIAPLMATLVGLPCPLNSVGNLPSHYLKLSKSDEVEAVLANTKQILNQFLRKSEQKQSSSLYFKPFKPLVNYSSVLDRIEDLISARDYKTAMKYSEELRIMALAGLHYFQTYDWFMLMTTITLGYIGWMANLILHVLQSYTTFPANLLKRTQVYPKNTSMKVYIGGCLFMGLSSIILLLEKSPPLYHAYVFMTIFLWTRIVQNYEFMKSAWRELFNMPFKYIMNLLISSVAALLILEFLVMSFFDRKLYTWCFLALGILASVCGAFSIEASPAVAIYTWLACWFLSVFTLMPAEIPENNNLVIFSGALIILIAMASRWATINTTTFWLYLNRANKQAPKSSMLFSVQVILISVSSIMVWLTTSHRSQHKELHPLHQLINWCVAGFAMALPLFSPCSVLSRLTSIFLGFAPPFLLLSIGYEAVFYSAFALVLMGWIFLESANLFCSEGSNSSCHSSLADGSVYGYDERCLQLSDLRIPLLFMILFNVAFFGTGNFASIASFEISSVYRFITIFSPFLMTALLIFKLFIPYMLVICTFSAITKIVRIPRIGCYFLVILLSDVMTIHFFFLVQNTGSWMEIGNSISHFGIVSAQVVFVLLLFALTNIYTKDIEVSSRQLTSRKFM